MIEYEITLRVEIPEGLPEEASRPFEEAFYETCGGEVTVTRAERLTPGINYGGPR